MIFIIALATILRSLSLSQSFWLDEAAQAVISAKPLSQINWAADFQPPLFYIFTHFWQGIGIKDEWFLRLLPVFFGVTTVYLTYRFFTKLFNEKVGLVSSLLLAAAPYHIYYSQEYRMYSFFAFLALASWITLYDKKWILFAIITAAALYTHYFAFLLITSQITYIAWAKREDIRSFAKSLIFSLLLFSPWLPTLQKQVQTAGNLISVWPNWKLVSGVPFLKFPFLLLAKITVGVSSPPKLVYGVIVGIVGIIFLLALFQIVYRIWYFVFRNKTSAIYDIRDTKYELLFCYFIVPVLLAWISGLWISANGPWRLLFVLPAFYGIMAVGIDVIPAKARIYLNRFRVKPGMTIFVVLFTSNLFFSFYYLFLPKNHRENWRQAINYSDTLIQEKRGVSLTEYIGPWSPMVWYSKNTSKYIGISNSLPISQKSIEKKLSPKILNTKYFILYTYLYPLSDPNRLAEQFLKKNGYKIVEEKDFKGVGIIQVYLK